MLISKDMKYNLIKENNLPYEKQEKNNTLKLLNSILDKKIGNNFANAIRENTKERNEKKHFYNFSRTSGIISYFYSTAQYLKDSNENNSIYLSILNSKNYVPKIVFQNKNYNKEDKNKNTKNYNFKNNDIYNNQYNNFNFYNFEQKEYVDKNNVFLNNNYINRNLSNENVLFSINIENDHIFNNPLCIKRDEQKNISNGYYKLFDDNKNYPSFIPSKYKKKEDKISLANSNHSEKTKSTSSFSEIGEDNSSFKSGEKLKKKTKEDEYLTEMFGKIGWICILCNNFNFKTRNKCNKCGALKKPKKILNGEEKNKETKEKINVKDGWICIYCKNWNYSFRNLCYRCKALRIDNILYHPLYSFTPSFKIFNFNI